MFLLLGGEGEYQQRACLCFITYRDDRERTIFDTLRVSNDDRSEHFHSLRETVWVLAHRSSFVCHQRASALAEGCCAGAEVGGRHECAFETAVSGVPAWSGHSQPKARLFTHPNSLASLISSARVGCSTTLRNAHCWQPPSNGSPHQTVDS